MWSTMISCCSAFDFGILPLFVHLAGAAQLVAGRIVLTRSDAAFGETTRDIGRHQKSEKQHRHLRVAGQEVAVALAIMRAIDDEHHGAENDHGDESDQRPAIEVQAEKRRSIRTRVRRDVREYLTGRSERAGERAENRDAVVRRRDAEADIQKEADSTCDIAGALQLA